MSIEVTEKGQNRTAAVVDSVKGQVLDVFLVQVIGNNICTGKAAGRNTLGPAIEYAAFIG